jgi:hypothetical protein
MASIYKTKWPLFHNNFLTKSTKAMNEQKKHSLVLVALMVLGIFITVMVIMIAVDVGKETPTNVNITNDVNDALETYVEEQPLTPSRIFSITGKIDSIIDNNLVITGKVYIDNVQVDRTYKVNINENTSITLVDTLTAKSSVATLNNFAVGDTVTMRSEVDLSINSEVTATSLSKIIN